jgi:hypothetical protein
VAAAARWQCRVGNDFTCSLVQLGASICFSSDAAAGHTYGESGTPSSLSVPADADTASQLQDVASASSSMGTGLAAAGGSSAVPAAAAAPDEAAASTSMLRTPGLEPAADCAAEAAAPGNQEQCGTGDGEHTETSPVRIWPVNPVMSSRWAMVRRQTWCALQA